MSNSLSKRFSFKLITNAVGLVLSLIIAGIIPRSLGPQAFGDFSFLTNFFERVFNFVDNGTSMAFYTKLSQRPKDKGLIRFYSGFIIFFSLLVFVLVAIAFGVNIDQILWPDQKPLFVLMALFLGLLTWVNKVMVKIVDAYALTTRGEIVQVLQKVVRFLSILLLFWLGLFTLFNFFLLQYFIMLFLFFGLFFLLKKNKISLFGDRKLDYGEIKDYGKEFYVYSLPLIAFSAFALVEGIYDRWLLQHYSGSVEQGYFGLSNSVAVVCFIFASAMTPLILREFSIAFQDNDSTKVRQLYLKFTPIFFLISAYFSVFVAVQSDSVVAILGGEEYKDAALALMIMALYPVHQTFGRFNGSYFLATNQTRLFGKIGVSFILLGLPISYLVIAPQEAFGFDLGSLGLAVKLVLVQLVGVNVEIWFISRKLQFSFFFLLMKQVIILGFLAIIGYTVHWAVGMLSLSLVPAFIVNGALYSLLVVVVIYIFPQLVSSSRRELRNQLNRLLKRDTNNLKKE